LTEQSEFAARIAEEAAGTTELLAGLHRDLESLIAASADANTDDEHDPEGATIAFERSQIGAFVEQVRQHLVEIDAAVERIESGRYGTCERCGSPISVARLEARPVARTCIDCAAAS